MHEFMHDLGLSDYYFADVVGRDPIDRQAPRKSPAAKRRVIAGFKAIMELMHLCLTLTISVDGKEQTPEIRTQVNNTRTKIIRLLCACELAFPDTFFGQYMHEMLHMADACSRWGTARNFWSFFPER